MKREKPKQIRVQNILSILRRIRVEPEKMAEIRTAIEESGKESEDFLNTDALQRLLGREIRGDFFAEYENNPPEE